jgi:hypothetical protein
VEFEASTTIAPAAGDVRAEDGAVEVEGGLEELVGALDDSDDVEEGAELDKIGVLLLVLEG